MNNCNLFINQEDVEEYLIEYRGDLLEQIKDIEYACTFIINNKLAIIAVQSGRLNDLRKEVPAIIFVNFRNVYILEGSSTSDVSNIEPIKINPYLNLTGRGIIIGIVDTGIDYTNQEFMREDNTSRIELIWDQSIDQDGSDMNTSDVFMGKVYNNNQINEAIKSKLSGKDPYAIVPSKDDIGHGTQIASIAGARGYDKDVMGVANDCTFAVVKLRESAQLKRQLKDNGITNVPVYYLSEIIAGIEYLKNYALNSTTPMVIICSVGTSDHSHDASDIFSRYLSDVASNRGLVFVSGCGNEGAAEGHTSGILSGIGDIKEANLKIESSMKSLSFKIWVRRPNKVSVAVLSPSGESSEFMSAKLFKEETIQYVFEDTTLKIDFYTWENISGLQVFVLNFYNIKPGVWKIRIRGDYIVSGRYDIWLPPHKTLKPNTKFLEPNSNQTINLAGSATNVISVSYYNQNNNSVVAESGRGFPLYPIIKPDIAAPGIDIIATSVDGRKVTVTGSSAATSIVAGTCALLMQWGIVDGNDLTMYSSKILSYLVAGAFRSEEKRYPDESLGYGTLDFLGTFDSISGLKSETRMSEGYIEYNRNNLFIRAPKDMEVRMVEI